MHEKTIGRQERDALDIGHGGQIDTDCCCELAPWATRTRSAALPNFVRGPVAVTSASAAPRRTRAPAKVDAPAPVPRRKGALSYASRQVLPGAVRGSGADSFRRLFSSEVSSWPQRSRSAPPSSSRTPTLMLISPWLSGTVSTTRSIGRSKQSTAWLEGCRVPGGGKLRDNHQSRGAARTRRRALTFFTERGIFSKC